MVVTVGGLGFVTGRVTAERVPIHAAPDDRLTATTKPPPTQLTRRPSSEPTGEPRPTPGVGTPRRAGFSPYAYVSLDGRRPLVETARETGTDEFTLAFVVSAGAACMPEWDGEETLRQDQLVTEVRQLRAQGGDVRVSFGGAAGKELALACPDEDELVAAYRTVIDGYRLTKVDFDVEGDSLANTEANGRRARAITRLQQEEAAAGRRLEVTFTLPVMPDGLTEEGSTLIEDAVLAGVDISGVNIMAMNYAPEYDGDMGDYAAQAATAAHEQVRELLDLTVGEAWAALEVTVMTGVNDIATEVFRPEDAEQLVEFAGDKGLGRLSMWSVGRDGPCPQEPEPKDTCSSIEQEPAQFLRIFAAYQGPGAEASPGATPSGR
ncbi:chitinase [Streptomyces sp. NPDC005125]